jgi:sulfite exporter TauE/SafE
VTPLLAAFVLGLAGSMHCVMMCGPLVVAARAGLGPHGFIFQAARIATYGALGVVAGLVGETLSFAGLARWAAIGAGLVVLMAAIGRVVPVSIGGRSQLPWLVSGMAAAGRLRTRHPFAAAAAMGGLNGLLPCGLVYVGLAGAVGMADLSSGAGFMLLFGLGTVPALAVVWSASAVLPTLTAPRRLAGLVPILVAVVGLVLIARGVHVPAGAAPASPTDSAAVTPAARSHQHLP